LLDGRSVLNEYFDHIVWESIPVHMNQIDRIEVVEGPASAVYGANAVSGVINIITKTPEQLNGGQVNATGGERHTEQTSLDYGKKLGNLAYKFGGAWSTQNQFQNADNFGADSGHFSSALNYDISDHSGVGVSGAVSRYATSLALGSGDGVSAMTDQGLSSFMNANYHFEDFGLHTNWNHLRSNQAQDPLIGNAEMDLDSYDVNFDQAVSLPLRQHLIFGAGYHRLDAESNDLANGSAFEDHWSAFAEHRWEIAEEWLLMTSGRVDRAPLTPIQFSPRGSLLYTPTSEQTIRASAGTSFRNPTLVENYLDTFFREPNPGAPPFTNPPFSAAQINALGNRTLEPERNQEVELDDEGRFGRFKTDVTAYHYIISHPITPTTPTPNPPFVPPTLDLTEAFTNVVNQFYATGGEAAVEYFASSWLKLFGNYSYVYMYGSGDAATAIKKTPRNKANTGFRTQNGHWTTQWSLDWVDSTEWPTATSPNPVSAYFLVNAHIGYAFSGALKGLEAGVNAFNLLNHDHYEVSPTQGAEIVKGTYTGTLSYKF